MPRPSTNRATTNQAKSGETAPATAPVIMMAATITYTRLRPSTSAIRPKTNAPTNAPRIAAPVTQLVWVVDRFHWMVTSAATVLMTNRSYASVKKPVPDTRIALRWKALIGAASSMALTVASID
jgi:hypothetical protein